MRRSDWAAVLGAGIGASLLPLLQGLAVVLEGRGLEDFPSPAIVLAATGGTAFGALTALPALRLNRARQWRLPDGLVIVLASGIGLAAVLLVTAGVVALRGGDAIAAVVLGGAAALPIGLGITVGALLFPVVADSRGRMTAGALLLVVSVCAALIIDR